MGEGKLRFQVTLTDSLGEMAGESEKEVKVAAGSLDDATDRGIIQVLEYLKRGGELDPLFVGKLALEHVPIIKELQWRKVLQAPPLRPTYLDLPETDERLRRVSAGLTVLELGKDAQS